MKKIRDFKCECGKVFEAWVEDSVYNAVCLCGGNAVRMVSSPKCFQNTTGKSPSLSKRG